MTVLSIRDAAREAGVSKTSIFRAIQSGRMSAPRKDDGGYAIDPAELFRVFPPKGSAGRGDTSLARSEGQTVPPAETLSESAGDMSLQVRLARAEAQLDALKEVLELERKRAEELRQERDKWCGLAEASQRQITHLTSKPSVPSVPQGQQGWWPWSRRRAG